MPSKRSDGIHQYEDVTLPVYSFGICKHWRMCGTTQVELGNGLCMKCWDMGMRKGA